MTIEKLLEKLEAKRDALNAAISEIRQYQVHTSTRDRAVRVMESIKAGVKIGHKYKTGTHWMQKPENRARVIAMAKARAKKRVK